MSAQQNKIKKIVFQGNQRISDAVVDSYLEVKVNEFYNKDKINQSVKELYKSGLFEDIRTEYKNGALTFYIKENPIISEVYFEGNKKINNDSLSAEISLKKRSIFTKAKLKNDVKRITDLYRRSGRFSAKVDAKIIEEEGNRIKLVFEIREGKKAKVKKIFFIGNEKFGEDTLQDILMTKEAKYLRFNAGEVYDPERLEYDTELLRRFYYSKGYADFEALSVIGEIKPEKNGFYVTFLLEEGAKYKFGDIQVINNIKKFDTKIIEKKVKIKKGKTFNANLLNESADAMIAEMGKYGYAFVDVEPRIKKDRARQIIDIDFIVHPVRKVYIGRINIRGNTRTLDEVIRRELRIQEGDPYNSTKIERSVQRLKNLGFFKDVRITKTQGITRNQIDLVVEVEEQKTGELNFGVGYSTVDGTNINIGIKEKNVLGTGRNLSFDWVRSEYSGKFDFGYGKPYFLNREMYAGFNIFYVTQEDQDTVSYNETSYGGSVNTSYRLTEYLSQKLYYSYIRDEIKDVSPNYANVISAQTNVTSLIGQALTYDRRDNVYDPHSGFMIRWTTDYAGLGGDKNYLSNTGKVAYYVPVVLQDLVFKVGARGGYINGIGEPLNPSDGFYLGGNSLRGFEYAGVGPRTINSITNSPKGGSAIGGKKFYVGETEFRFPLGLPKEYRIFGSLFANAGTVTGVDDGVGIDKGRVADSASIRSAYGFSISWASPMGPIGLDFSNVINKEDYDIEENFRFSFGTNF